MNVPAIWIHSRISRTASGFIPAIAHRMSGVMPAIAHRMSVVIPAITHRTSGMMSAIAHRTSGIISAPGHRAYSRFRRDPSVPHGRPQPFARLSAPVGGAAPHSPRPNGPEEPSEGLRPRGWIDHEMTMNRQTGRCPGGRTSPTARCGTRVTPTRRCGIGHHHRHRHGIQNMAEHEYDKEVSR